MLDVSKKFSTLRIATATARLKMQPATVEAVRRGEVPKGDALTVAKVAAVQAAKDTSKIIPYCHPMQVDYVGVEFELGEDTISATVTIKAIYKTGVEMEAVTGAAVAALTLYDMLKMIDETMEITGITLDKKKGGKSDFKDNYKEPIKACVLVMSDSIVGGKKEDKSGKVIEERLKAEGAVIVEYKVVSDDLDGVVAELCRMADDLQVDLIMTTGGTGFSPRDNAPEAMLKVVDREIPGINEAMRAHGQLRTPFSMLSRGKAGLRGRTLIVNMPGSTKGVVESLDALFPGLFHSFKMIRGYGHLDSGLGADK